MTKFKEWNINEPVNLLVGGTPCQSFSVAGLRKGLADPRGNLMLTYLAMADHFKPKWLLWENVPGVLSSNGGHDFAALLQGMAELGYGVSYRVLDAQHFGVPQRRRRVFVVGCLGDWRSAAKVLFESESLRRDITPSRNKREEIANCLTKSPSSYNGFNPASSEGNGVVWPAPIASTLNASFGSKLGLENQHINSGAPLFVQTVYETHPMDSRIKDMGDVCQTVSARWGTGGGNVPIAHNVAYSFDSLSSNSMKSKNPNSGCREVDLSKTLDTACLNPTCNQGGIALAHAFKVRGGCAGGGKGYLGSDEKAFTISTTQDQQLFTDMRVRRLTPMECERLQGFPDNYTDTPTSSDSTRYKALGNSMAVPVMKWIGERINNV
jgi:DNA (cytosine-5)-methyltransferase 1